MQDDLHEKKRILDREDLRYALDTMSKLVSNYTYDLSKRWFRDQMRYFLELFNE